VLKRDKNTYLNNGPGRKKDVFRQGCKTSAGGKRLSAGEKKKMIFHFSRKKEVFKKSALGA